MNKGKAIICARLILGPGAYVRYSTPLNGKVECVVSEGFPDYNNFTGDTWVEALRKAEAWKYSQQAVVAAMAAD
jgi:hypothetical protein